MGPIRAVFKRMFGRWANSPQDQSFYVKMVFALLSGVLCALAGDAFRGIRGIVFGILIYIISLYAIVYLLEVDPSRIGGRQKLIVDSLASYLLLWVLVWTLLIGFVTL
ncbi:MAG: hypothetical protein QXS20_01100 [Candidatus Thorarchaeota archaeon]